MNSCICEYVRKQQSTQVISFGLSVRMRQDNRAVVNSDRGKGFPALTDEVGKDN